MSSLVVRVYEDGKVVLVLACWKVKEGVLLLLCKNILVSSNQALMAMFSNI
jgi:hypothetical protein